MVSCTLAYHSPAMRTRSFILEVVPCVVWMAAKVVLTLWYRE